MILTPDDHRSLQVLDGRLAACEPHLAAMFTIFSRLNAEEPPPPTEDLIASVRPAVPAPAPPVKSRRRRTRASGTPGATRATGTARSRLAARRGDRGWRPMAAIAIPVLLLVTVVVVMFFSLASAMKCSPGTTAAATSRSGSSPTALAVPGGASLASCQQSTSTAKTGG